LLQG
ncbi:hypothetical protein BN1708_018976, partial [Verticillium longisporum]